MFGLLIDKLQFQKQSALKDIILVNILGSLLIFYLK